MAQPAVDETTTRHNPRAEDAFPDLIRRLAEGWRIEGPVYVMANPAREGESTYQFILWRNDEPGVITLRDSGDVRELIQSHQLALESI